MIFLGLLMAGAVAAQTATCTIAGNITATLTLTQTGNVLVRRRCGAARRAARRAHAAPRRSRSRAR